MFYSLSWEQHQGRLEGACNYLEANVRPVLGIDLCVLGVAAHKRREALQSSADILHRAP